MVKKVILAISLMVLLLIPGNIWIQNLNFVLFLESWWIMPAVIAAVVTTGLVRSFTKKKNRPDPVFGAEPRHTIDSFLEHWGTAAGIFILIVSGFQIRSGSNALWGMNLHYEGLFITLVFGSYFLINFFIHKKYNTLLPSAADILDGTLKKYIMRARWTDEGKYLASQKSAILAFTFLGIGILLTGAVKMVVHFAEIPPVVTSLATATHDFLAAVFVLMLLVHIALVALVRSHRMLIRSWFTGMAPEFRVKNTETVMQTPPDYAPGAVIVESEIELDPMLNLSVSDPEKRGGDL